MSDLDLATLRAIVSSSEDAIVTKTIDSLITSWNPAAERLFGYAAGEIIGRPITQLFPADRLASRRSLPSPSSPPRWRPPWPV